MAGDRQVSRLGGEQLLDVADGNPPARNRTIVDYDLSKLPELPPSYSNYDKRMETRMKYQCVNDANAAKRELNRALDRIEAGYQAQERFISNATSTTTVPPNFRPASEIARKSDTIPPKEWANNLPSKTK